jgi:dihydroorotase
VNGSLIIRGPVFTGAAVRETGVRIEGGVIVAVADGDLGPADREIALGPGETLLPAGIDTLCAMRDWGEAPRDTVETVTKGALAGGVTLVCDQANTVPRINTPELAARRSATIAAESYADFTVGAHPPAEPARLAEYRDAGVHSLQLFPWDLSPWNTPRDYPDGSADFARFAEAGFGAVIFPDEQALRETPWRDEGERFALEALLRRVPPEWKVRLLVSRPHSVEMILEARDRLPNLQIQVPPHVLLMSREEGFRRIGLGATQVPPLRPEAEVAAMRAFAEQGAIDIVCSHHAPHRIADKYSTQPIPGEFTPKVGYSAIDFFYPLMLAKFGFELGCRMVAEAPADALGLKRGRIAKGHDADLIVVKDDPGPPQAGIHVAGGVPLGLWQVEPLNFQSRGKVTPFAGERLTHRVMKTFLRGEEVYDAETQTFTRTAVRQLR